MELMNKKIVEANIQLQDINKDLQKRINNAIEFINETKEYYSDGVDEELIDMLRGELANE